MTITANTGSLITRLQRRFNRLSPDSPEMRTALTKIGITLTAQTIINIRKNNLIDTGRLINSVRYELFKDSASAGVRVGSFGVPYAAVHEFGFHGNVLVKPHSRTVSRAFGHAIDPVTFMVGMHNRKMNVRKRPFLAPAVRKHREFVIRTIRQAFRG